MERHLRQFFHQIWLGDDVNEAERFIADGRVPDINQTDDENIDAMLVAIFRYRENIFDLLIKYGAAIDSDTHRQGCDLVNKVIVANNTRMLRTLLALGSSMYPSIMGRQSALELACRRVKGEMAAMLLNAGCDPSHPSDNGASLVHAVQWADLNLIKRLLDGGANPNKVLPKEHMTPLIAACARHPSSMHHFTTMSFSDLIGMLLAYGADPHFANDLGETALHAAAREGNITAVELFVAAGVNLDIATTNQGLTALAYATRSKNLAIVKLLLDHGANVSRTISKDLQTPLTRAVLKGKLDIVKCLIEHGADIQERNYEGLSPVQIAHERRFMDILKHLLSVGADASAEIFDSASVMEPGASLQDNFSFIPSEGY